MQSLTLGKKSQPTPEYAPSLRSPSRASMVFFLPQFVKNDTISALRNNLSVCGRDNEYCYCRSLY
ncbi:hypothetical protein [Candidiatus Paracoxiella cheracis]|uniref:hypothetical protein n=1 Tax=Candidiatus Paracoxiella cheracis TaxID=3405120 RepID=UPI003BF56CDC